MNAAQGLSTRPVPIEIQEIPLDRIQESKGNPRRTFDEAKLRELAENIKVHGVLQPVLVRPLPGSPKGTYELVAGARRFRASKLAGKQTIPATVRELNDAECREIQLIENLQRADIHELDEALGSDLRSLSRAESRGLKQNGLSRFLRPAFLPGSP